VTIHDSVALVAGVPLLAIVPALVELAKRHGLPVRYAGGAAIGFAIVLLILGDLALDASPDDAGWSGTVARWLIGGVVYGLAAAGLYSQRGHVLPRDTRPTSARHDQVVKE
jgi:hypothetical protein